MRPETKAEVESLLERAPRDESPRVLATLVATAGSTYRKPGARMLITSDGHTVGSLSGGCLEEEVVERARTVLRTGTPCDTVIDGVCRDTYTNAPVGARSIYARALHVAAIAGPR